MIPIAEANSLGLSADPRIIIGLKIFGFWLHMVFMNLWLVGIPTGLVLWKFREDISKRLFKLMPFFMAFGINAGVVPLLFIQTLYGQQFYSATILQAWFWFSVIPLLCIAYYAIYLVSSGYYRVLAGTVAFLLIAWIGLNFSSAMTLAADSTQWDVAFQQTTTGGAVHGTYFLVTPEVLFRYGIMIGLGLLTTAAFLSLDAEFLGKSHYQSAPKNTVFLLTVLGLAVFGLSGYRYQPYILEHISANIRWFTGFLTVGMGAIGLLYSVIPNRLWAGVFSLGQLGVLLMNAIVRQIGQTSKIGGFERLAQMPTRGETLAVIIFFLTLLAGLAVIGWIGKIVVWRIHEPYQH